MQGGIQQPFFSCMQMAGGSQQWQSVELAKSGSYVYADSNVASQTNDQSTFLMQLKNFTGKRKIDVSKSQERERTTEPLDQTNYPDVTASPRQNASKRRRGQIGYWNFLPQQFIQQKQQPPPLKPTPKPDKPIPISREIKSYQQRQQERDEQFDILQQYLSQGTVVQPGTKDLPPLATPTHKRCNSRTSYKSSRTTATLTPNSNGGNKSPTYNPTPTHTHTHTHTHTPTPRSRGVIPTPDCNSFYTPNFNPTPTPTFTQKVSISPTPTPASTQSHSSSCEQNYELGEESYIKKWECKIVDRKGNELLMINAKLTEEVLQFLPQKMVLIGYTKRSQLVKAKIENSVRVSPKGKKMGIQQVAQMKLVGLIEGENEKYDFALVFDQPKLVVQLAFVQKGFLGYLKQNKKLLM